MERPSIDERVPVVGQAKRASRWADPRISSRSQQRRFHIASVSADVRTEAHKPLSLPLLVAVEPSIDPLGPVSGAERHLAVSGAVHLAEEYARAGRGSDGTANHSSAPGGETVVRRTSDELLREPRGESNGICAFAFDVQAGLSHLASFVYSLLLLEILATQGSALLRISEEELTSISQVTFKCEQYFGAATRAGGGVISDDGAHLFSTVAEFIAAFRAV